MEINKKTILFGIGFLGVVFLIGYGIYFMFFRQSVVTELTQPKAEITREEEGRLKPSELRGPGGISYGGAGKLPEGAGAGRALSEAQIVSAPSPQKELPSEKASGGPTLVSPVSLRKTEFAKLSGGKMAFYDKDEGKFYKIDPISGDLKLLSDKIFKSAQKVTWSPKSDRAVLEFPDGSNIVYDFDSQTQTTLPKEWEKFSFDPSGERLGFQYISPYSTENNWLAVSNVDGGGVRTVEPIGDQINNVQVDWKPTGEIAATFRSGKDLETQEVIFLGLNGENFKSMPLTGRGFEGKWSPEGNKIVYSVYNSQTSYRPSLWVASAQGDDLGQNRTPLEIKTWPQKCAFGDENMLYCAVPKYLESYSGVYKELAQGVPDDIYRIDLKTGIKTKLAELVNRQSSSVYTVKEITVDEDKGYLYFVDAITGGLNQVRLR